VSAALETPGIIILGAPRSGTTLLRRLINAHPNIDCPGETNVFAACGRFLRSERIAEGVDIGVVEGLGYAGFSRGEILRRLRELAFSFHHDHAVSQRKPRWASKTAFDAFYLPEIEQLCGDDALFVCLQRHGIDVACSIEDLCNKNGVYLKELHEYIQRYPRMIEAFAHVWVDLTQAIHAFVKRHPTNTMLIAYEELVEKPNDIMANVMQFVGEQWDPALLADALASRSGLGLGDWKTYGRNAVDRSSVGRWTRLSRHTISELGGICNATLAACGYDAVPLDSSRSPEEGQRRYEMGLLLQGMKRAPATNRDAATARPAAVSQEAAQKSKD